MAVIGCEFYDYYGFICNPTTHTLPSLVNLMAQFHSPHVVGQSPGKGCTYFRSPTTFTTSVDYGKDFGLWWLGAPHPLPTPYEGSLSLSREL